MDDMETFCLAFQLGVFDRKFLSNSSWHLYLLLGQSMLPLQII